MRLFSGYSEVMFTQRRLKEVAHQLAETLPFLMERSGATAIAVRGKSGIALAFAVSAVAEECIPIIVCRKNTERSHGSPIEGRDIETNGLRYMILDDFVSSGDTVRGIVADLEALGAKACTGVVVYHNNRSDTIRKHSGLSMPIIDGTASIPALRRALAERASFAAEEAHL